MAKRKNVAPTPEEQEAFNLARLREIHINPPTILFQVGQRVLHGNVKESHVTEILLGGKILKLHETCTQHNYGNPYDYERDMYVAWHDIVPWKDWQESEILSTREHRLSYSQRDIRGLLGTYYNFGIEMDPDYQRGSIWGLEDKLALIDSIFDNVDIGKFVMVHRDYRPNTKLYEIVDGKQRLSALVEFYESRFSWRGKFFYELHPRDQMFFECYNISYAEIPDENRETILRTFVKLNTGGKPQDPVHLEKVRKLLEEEQKIKLD